MQDRSAGSTKSWGYSKTKLDSGFGKNWQRETISRKSSERAGRGGEGEKVGE